MSSYQFPPDEFDDFERRQAPVGVHRAPRSKWSRIWPFLMVAALCATVAVVGIWLLARPGATDLVDAIVPVITEPAEPEPEEPEETDPGYYEGEDYEPEPEGPAPDSLEALLAAADLSLAVRVLNDTAPSGEAGRGASALADAGFIAATAGNYPGNSGLTATSVWYSGENLPTALAVAKVLGIPEDRVTEHATEQAPINVILRGALTPPAAE